MLLRLTLMAVLRVRIRGLDQLPERGGAMLLANHTTFMDVLVCFWGLHRPSRGIGSDQVFRLPVVGRTLKLLGGIPYAKGGKDGDAVRALASAYEAGSVVGMFPEGLRSWTGAPLPIRAGTGKLVKSLGCPVIYCKVRTGFLQHPRWATYPRWIPWEMEYSTERFAPDATPEEINAAIARGIAIDPDKVELPAGSYGWRLAAGLPEFLWACPGCFAVEGLEVTPDRDHVRCRSCGERWRVDLACRLHSDHGEVLSVAAARARLDAHFTRDTPVSAEHLEVSLVKRGQLRQEHVATGAARLTDTGLELRQGDAVVWSMAYDDMEAVLLQFRNALQIRSQGVTYQLDPRGQSRLRWHHFLALRANALVG